MKKLSAWHHFICILYVAIPISFANAENSTLGFSNNPFAAQEAIFITALESKDFHFAGELINELTSNPHYPVSQQYQLIIKFFDRVLSTKDLDELPKFKTQVLELAKHVPEYQQAELNLRMTELLLYQGRYEAGVQRAKLGIKLLANSPSETYADLHYFLGALNGRMGKNDLALENIIKAIDIRESNHLAPNLRYYLGLMAVYSQSGNTENGLEYGNKALELAGNDHPILHLLHLNLSASYADIKDYEKTIYHSQKSIDIANKKGIENNLPYVNIGNAYVELGEYDKAIEVMSKVYQLFNDNNQHQWLATVTTVIADAYVGLEQREIAQEYYMRAHKAHMETDIRMHRLSFYPTVIENLVALKNYKQAYEMLDEFKTLNDETRVLEADKYIQELKTTHDLKLKKEQIAILENDKALQAKALEAVQARQAAEQKNGFYVQLLSASLFVIVVILFWNIHNRARNNRELAQKNRNIKKLNDDLKKLSTADNLTGLYNRHYLTEFINSKQLRRRSGDKQNHNIWSILLLDIDHFKKFNDTYGHHAGDLALVHFSNTLTQVKRDSDILIRWGGEEFIWLCADSELSETSLAFSRLQSALEISPVKLENGKSINITASAGSHSFINSELTPESWARLLTQVDEALYHSKQGGRNRCTLFSDLQIGRQTKAS